MTILNIAHSIVEPRGLSLAHGSVYTLQVIQVQTAGPVGRRISIISMAMRAARCENPREEQVEVDGEGREANENKIRRRNNRV